MADLTECYWKAEVDVEVAGSFEYFIRLGDGREGDKESLVVEPDLILPKGTAEEGCLQAEQVCCVTMVTKCMGGLKRWRALADSAARMEYNMLHLTPVQRLGMSGSAYSLYDQLSLTDLLLPREARPLDPGALSENERSALEKRKETELRAFVKDIYEKFGYVYSQEFEDAMKRYLAERPKTGVKYSLEGIGLTNEDIEESFSDYIDTYKQFF